MDVQSASQLVDNPAYSVRYIMQDLLNVNNIEVIYNHVILALKGVSVQCGSGQIVALLGGNGAGKTTTLRAISNLLEGERGKVTRGSIQYQGKEIQNDSTAALVKKGIIQVMEGRHCFSHLTIEENLLVSGRAFESKQQLKDCLDKIYGYFPRLKEKRKIQAAYTSGGEQQMCAIGRAIMAQPKLILLDEPSMGLAPQLVDEIFTIIKSLNADEGITFLLAEQNVDKTLKYAHYGYIMENGRMVMQGEASQLAQNSDVKEFYLGGGVAGRINFRDVKSYRRRKRWLT